MRYQFFKNLFHLVKSLGPYEWENTQEQTFFGLLTKSTALIYYRLKKVVGFYYSLVLVIKVTSSLNFRLFAIQCIVSVVRSVLTNIDGLDRLHSLQARLKALFKDCHVNIKLSMKCWEMTFLGSKGRFALFFLFYHFE